MTKPHHSEKATDWVEWHRNYDDPSSELSKRLAVVQDFAAGALQSMSPGRCRILSLCAGDARDIVPVLARFERRDDTTALLVENDPDLVASARSRARQAGLTSVEVRQADAGDPTSFRDSVPVNLLLVCGIFGNINTDDLATTIAALPSFLCPTGQVLWTRGASDPDLRPHVRSLFASAGFEEVRYDGAPAAHGVGLARLNTRGGSDGIALPSRLYILDVRPGSFCDTDHETIM